MRIRLDTTLVRLFRFQQFFNAAGSPAGPCPGGVLDLVTVAAVPLSSLAGVTKLPPEPFCPIVQATAQKLLRSGCRPLLQALFSGLLFFDFIDSMHLLRKKRAVYRTADSPLSYKI